MKTKSSTFVLRDTPHFFASALKKHSHYATLFIQESPTIHSEIVIIAPKKTFTLATQRNFVKRRLKAILKEIVLKTKPIIIVAIAKSDSLSQTHDNIKKELTEKCKNV